MTRNKEITNFMQVISLDTLPLRRRRVGSQSVAEILIHIAFFSNFDYLFHGEEHVTAVEAFDLGLSSTTASHKRRSCFTETQ